MNICIVPGCEAQTRGVRCDPHARAEVQLATARRFDEHDRALLADVAAGLTAQRLGVRMGVSRQFATRTIRKAQRRQKVLAGELV